MEPQNSKNHGHTAAVWNKNGFRGPDLRGAKNSQAFEKAEVAGRVKSAWHRARNRSGRI